MLEVLPRDKKYFEGYRDYCREFYDNKITYFVPTDPARLDDGWFERTADWYKRKESRLVPGYAKSFHYWAIDKYGDRFIGEFQLRTELDDEIMTGIGSIGYSVRVSEWGKGYGTEILRQGLEIAKSHGMDRVLLNINDANAVSIHVCEKLGGELWDTVTAENRYEGVHLMRRYWIYLK
jgi:Predicted acetyltransferase